MTGTTAPGASEPSAVVRHVAALVAPQLKKARANLVTDVPPGSYTVEVLLVRNNQVIAAQTTPMFVSKTGIGAEGPRAHSGER